MGNNRKRLGKKVFCFIVISILVFGLTDTAKSEEKILTVAIEITAPCVMYSNGAYTGFDIELC